MQFHIPEWFVKAVTSLIEAKVDDLRADTALKVRQLQNQDRTASEMAQKKMRLENEVKHLETKKRELQSSIHRTSKVPVKEEETRPVEPPTTLIIRPSLKKGTKQLPPERILLEEERRKNEAAAKRDAPLTHQPFSALSEMAEAAEAE
jgi:hypothetical protein